MMESRFVSALFITMCSRLGIRCTLYQAHRPNANGRAEVAGKVICDVLREVTNEKEREGQSWVEIPSLAIRLHHDVAYLETVFRPYQ